MKIEWLDRALTTCAYYYCLILSAEDFFAELRRIKLPEHRWGPFLSQNAHATTHHFEHDGKMIAMVCLDKELSAAKTGRQVAALLVHEAVHIWQRHAAFIGSHNDHGDEEEAYAIQNIAQALMESYAEQTH